MFVNNLGCDCCPRDVTTKRILARNLVETVQALRNFEILDKLDSVDKGIPLCERGLKAMNILREVQNTFSRDIVILGWGSKRYNLWVDVNTEAVTGTL